MDPAASAAKTVLTPQEEADARSLHNADIWQRNNAKRCWADPFQPKPLVEMSCPNDGWSGCSLGLCEEHCKEVHVDSRSRFHRQSD